MEYKYKYNNNNNSDKNEDIDNSIVDSINGVCNVEQKCRKWFPRTRTVWIWFIESVDQQLPRCSPYSPFGWQSQGF